MGAEKTHKSVYVVFISLLMDLLAFTIILPLFPSLFDHYKTNDKWGLYSWLSSQIYYFQSLVGAPEKFNSVLFGGFLGSMYSFLQFLASPIVGGLSDVYGRKIVMLICLTGISASYLLWAMSSNLLYFVLARFIGGLSKGNISICMAIITDVSSMKTRGKGMALVGIAFSLGFLIGPMIGAMFAVWAKNHKDWFIAPALFALFLAISDLIFFAVFFEESLPAKKRAKSTKASLQNAKTFLDVTHLFRFSAIKNINPVQKQELQKLGLIYFTYLFIYSGLEFTLTFLTHHVFNFTSMQQGWMFLAIGLTMALVQGTFLRRMLATKAKLMAILGLWLIIPSYVFVGIAKTPIVLYFGLLLFALSTSLCVPSITTLVSKYGSDQEKGTLLGIFRSLGALARAVGPILASIAFWGIGSQITYLGGAVCLLYPVLALHRM